MSTPKIGNRLTLDGEREYKAALSEINGALRVLGSEMKLTQTRFAEQADSLDALTAENDILERQLLTQREKVETLRSALQKSVETYGEASTKTSNYRVSLNNAEAELVKMERALKDSTDQLDRARSAADTAGGSYDGMGDDLDGAAQAASGSESIFSRLRQILLGVADSGDDVSDASKRMRGEAGDLEDSFGDAADKGLSFGDAAEKLSDRLGINLPEGAKKALDAIGPVGTKFSAMLGWATALAAAVAAVETALAGITSERADYATGIANIAQTINMSVESTQIWDYVLKTVGSSIEEAQGDLSAFQEKILEASQGTGEAYEMFQRLGVAVVDQAGNLRSSEDVLNDVVTALQLMANETERNAISSTLLGSTGEKLIPIYNMTAQELEFLKEQKREIGVLTGDEIESLKKVSQAMIDYEERTAAAKDALAKDFAPALADFYDAAGEGLLGLGKSAEDSNLVGFFGSVLSLITALSPAFDLLGSAMELLSPAFAVLSIAIAGVSDALRVLLELLAAVGNLLTLDFTGAGQNWDNIMGILSGQNSAVGNAINSAFNASGTDNFPGGWSWVGENGPERIWMPQGSRVFTAQESRSMGGDVFYITIDAHSVQEFNDIIRMAQAAKRMKRMEGSDG